MLAFVVLPSSLCAGIFLCFALSDLAWSVVSTLAAHLVGLALWGLDLFVFPSHHPCCLWLPSALHGWLLVLLHSLVQLLAGYALRIPIVRVVQTDMCVWVNTFISPSPNLI